MLFHIKHATRYRYTRPVFCEPMTIRLRPREDVAQRLLRYNLWIDPEPAGMSHFVDLDGHTATQVWFDRLVTSLSIVVSSTVETLRTNPFDFLLDPVALRLPMVYPTPIQHGLMPYLELSPPEPGTTVDTCCGERARDPAFAETLDRLLRITGAQTLPFLSELTNWIHSTFEKIIRDEGAPCSPSETLRTRRGSCRDLTVLFNELCREAGLAARFVSGYHEREGSDGRRHLHAWSEVYLPGAGWRGYDPMAGLAVADRHVALASGAEPILAAPTYGTFRGTGASSTMDTQLVIRTADGDSAAEADINVATV
ncbi:MAG: transglutaminase family protein [Planctomycetia bacterium]|nr:transglutaminase family protein [Planctomycetia bacterium]